MSDLVERLHILQRTAQTNQLKWIDEDYVIELAGKAADEIERLRAALEKFAKLPCSEYDTLEGTMATVHILARQALNPNEE